MQLPVRRGATTQCLQRLFFGRWGQGCSNAAAAQPNCIIQPFPFSSSTACGCNVVQCAATAGFTGLLQIWRASEAHLDGVQTRGCQDCSKPGSASLSGDQAWYHSVWVLSRQCTVTVFKLPPLMLIGLVQCGRLSEPAVPALRWWRCQAGIRRACHDPYSISIFHHQVSFIVMNVDRSPNRHHVYYTGVPTKETCT